MTPLAMVTRALTIVSAIFVGVGLYYVVVFLLVVPSHLAREYGYVGTFTTWMIHRELGATLAQWLPAAWIQPTARALMVGLALSLIWLGVWVCVVGWHLGAIGHRQLRGIWRS